MINRLFFQEAYNQALKSEMNFNHGAVLIYRGRIVGKGYNTYINSSYNEKNSIHAEISAIKNGLKKISTEELKKCELVIIRVNRLGECLNSKPCHNCENFIKKFNIKKVFHS
jgi:tRNA(Arg) A34 adenosine deaminase TadA